MNVEQDCLVRRGEQEEERYEEIQNELEKVTNITVYCKKCRSQTKSLLEVGCTEYSLGKARKGIVFLTGRYQYCKDVTVFYTVLKMDPVPDATPDLPITPKAPKAKVQPSFGKRVEDREERGDKKFDERE